MELDTSAVQQVEQQLRGYPAQLHRVLVKAVGATAKQGRKHMVQTLFKALALRWDTIIKRRALFKFTGPTSGEITIYDEPMQMTAFQGHWSNKA